MNAKAILSSIVNHPAMDYLEPLTRYFEPVMKTLSTGHRAIVCEVCAAGGLIGGKWLGARAAPGKKGYFLGVLGSLAGAAIGFVGSFAAYREIDRRARF